MKCERCSSLWDNQAKVRIRSDVINLAVCGQCAREALDLGLAYELLREPQPMGRNGSAPQPQKIAKSVTFSIPAHLN